MNYNMRYNINSLKIVATLYHLENNEKQKVKSLSKLGTNAISSKYRQPVIGWAYKMQGLPSVCSRLVLIHAHTFVFRRFCSPSHPFLTSQGGSFLQLEGGSLISRWQTEDAGRHQYIEGSTFFSPASWRSCAWGGEESFSMAPTCLQSWGARGIRTRFKCQLLDFG